MEARDAGSTGDARVAAPQRSGQTNGAAAAATSVCGGSVGDSELRRQLQRARFVRDCAERLLLDMAVTATAVLLCQQFYASKPEAAMDDRVIGGACVFLATKSCETPRTLRSVVNVVHAVMNGDSTEPLAADATYANLKNSLINAEQSVLRVLHFDVDVVLPHTYLLNYARHANFSESTAHCAVALVNDALCTIEALRFPPYALAAACLRAASQMTQDDTLGAEKWWYLYDTSDEDIEAIVLLLGRILDFHSRGKHLQS